MSRSYQKVAGFSDYSRKKTRYYKRQASKKVRRYKDDLSNGEYKKLYESWSIRDYSFRYFSLKEVMSNDYGKEYWYRFYMK